MTVVQDLGYSFSSGKGVELLTSSQYVCRTKEEHTSVGHRLHVKPVLEVSEFFS